MGYNAGRYGKTLFLCASYTYILAWLVNVLYVVALAM